MQIHNSLKLFLTDEGFWTKGQMHFAAIEDEVLVGVVDLHDFEPISRRAAVGIVVDKQYRRQGRGLVMLCQLISMAKRDLHLHQIYADIAVCNHASMRLFTKAGFETIGTMKEWVMDGDKYLDVCRMQLLLNGPQMCT